jgi:hypothetical protein
MLSVPDGDYCGLADAQETQWRVLDARGDVNPVERAPHVGLQLADHIRIRGHAGVSAFDHACETLIGAEGM